MAKTVVASGIGNSVGPSTNKFHAVAQLAYEGADSTGYTMYARYHVTVTNGQSSVWTNYLRCSWRKKTPFEDPDMDYNFISLGAAGDYADSDWIKLGTYAYGKSVSISAFAYYYTSSDVEYKSSVSASYTIPYPTCSISYNANSGTGAPSKQTYTYASSGITHLSPSVPQRQGYKFLGWSLSSTATSPSYYAGQTWNLSNYGDYTLYAVWGANVLTVNYYSNFATESFSSALNQVGAGKNVIVRSHSFYYGNNSCSAGGTISDL